MLRSAQIFFVRNACHAVEVDADLLLSGCFNVEWGLLEIASLFAHFISRALTNTKRGRPSAAGSHMSGVYGREKPRQAFPPQNLRRGCFEPATWWLSETALTTAPGPQSYLQTTSFISEDFGCQAMVFCTLAAYYTSLLLSGWCYIIYFLSRRHQRKWIQSTSASIVMMRLRGSVLKRSPSRSALMPKTFLCQVDYWTLQWDLSMILIREFLLPLLKSCFWTWHLSYGP